MNCYIKISESLEKRRNSLLKKGGIIIKFISFYN
jgi:hypothetical protein